MTTMTTAINIPSAANFNIQHLRPLSEAKAGTITTSDNGRCYHVFWHQSGTFTVQRDTSNVDVFTRLMEFFERGISTPTFATQLTGRLNELSNNIKNEEPLRQEIDARLQTINSYKTSLQNSDSTITFITSYPAFKDEGQLNDAIREQCYEHSKCAEEQYQKAMSAKQNALIRELDGIKDRLTALKRSDELPPDFRQQMVGVANEIQNLDKKISQHGENHKAHRDIIRLYSITISFARTTLVNQFLLVRTTMLSNAISEFVRIDRTDEEQQSYSNFLKQQHEVARNLVLYRNSTVGGGSGSGRISALEECGELFTPPNHLNEKTYLEMTEIYQGKSARVVEFLTNHETTWDQIDTEMTELERYKAMLTKQINLGQEIDTLIEKDTQKSMIAIQQNRLDELKSLRERCHMPGLDVCAESLCTTAENNIKATRSVARISDFLNNFLIGKRGVSPFKHNYYDAPTQIRICSLIDIETTFLQDIELTDDDINSMNYRANEHINAITQWANDNLHFENKLIAGFYCNPDNLTFERMQLLEQDKKHKAKTKEIKQEMNATMLTLRDDILLIQERKEALTIAQPHAKSLLEASIRLEEKMTDLKNSYGCFYFLFGIKW